MTVLYLKVSNDEYRLPEIIAASPGELAEKVGVKPQTVKSAISHAKRHGWLCQYERVEVEDDD